MTLLMQLYKMKYYIDMRNDTGRFIDQQADKGTFKRAEEGKVTYLLRLHDSSVWIENELNNMVHCKRIWEEFIN
jgi:hypothetical protein